MMLEREDDIRIYVGTDLPSLTKVGLLAWQQGYLFARADAPRARTLSERQQAAESSCRQCFTHYAPLDAITLQRAYFLGWHMGYAASVRGDVWIPHSSPSADVIEMENESEIAVDALR